MAVFVVKRMVKLAWKECQRVNQGKKESDLLKRVRKKECMQIQQETGRVNMKDRGCRSSVTKLNGRLFAVKIPPHLMRNQKQLTPVQANQHSLTVFIFCNRLHIVSTIIYVYIMYM